MRVVMPYTRQHPEALAALSLHAPKHNQVYVGYYDLAYFHLICQLWVAGDGWINVEHDVVIHATVVEQFETCPEPWCVFGVPRHRPPHEPLLASLGCTRFSADLIAKVPDMPARLGTWTAGREPGHWSHLDTAIGEILTVGGYQPHPHTPTVQHLPKVA